MAIERIEPRRLTAAVTLALAVFCVAALLAPLAGSATVDWKKAVAGEWPDSEILFGTRVPRVLLALLSGGSLSLAGVLFQALLRDALATPYTMGISSGASLGAVLAICFGIRTLAGLPGLWVAAFAGSLLTLVLVLAIAADGRRMSSFTLLLAGVTMNSISMAFILLLHNTADFGQSFAIVRWLMGSLEPLDYKTLLVLLATVLPVSVWLFVKARQWNLMAVGEEWAAARGVSPARLLLSGSIAGSILTAFVTALTGPIGFVGLIVPHALRLRYGADHRVLMPCAFLWGGTFLLVCDTIARVAMAPAELPVGVITAIIGGPWFIVLLRSRRRSLWV
ncbi:MAG: iron ABC transporter permease [Bryobacterales bacterium]|nr:iron ABC transporter permease [Bryobacterales bacterium]